MRRTLVGGLIAATLASTACYTMRTVSLDELGGLKASRAWVTKDDQTTVIVSGPRTFGDTLVGYVNGQFEELLSTDVKQIIVRRPARTRTFALVAVGLVSVGAVAAAVSGTFSGHRDPERLLDCEDDPFQPGCPLGPPLP
jgi:hypothetical protein